MQAFESKRSKSLVKILFFTLLLIYLLMLMIPTQVGIFSSFFFILLFYTFIPGYAFTLLMPATLSKQQIIMLSLAFNLAIFTTANTFLRITIIEFGAYSRINITPNELVIFLAGLIILGKAVKEIIEYRNNYWSNTEDLFTKS